MQFTARGRHDGAGATRVTIAGELDIATAADFGIELARLIDDRGPHVLIDTSALTFCDARGSREAWPRSPPPKDWRAAGEVRSR
ncbi:STAS domain-containing protein [Actinomadura madurae]|uniref:STAS domain-containing protein n=1 Tax=Actinomadura madurae TaxID=1993 RepID=UPI00399AEDE7